MNERKLRKYIKAILLEKRFADFGTSKGEWIDIPEEELAVHTPEIDIDDEIFDLVSTAYSGIGGNLKIQSPENLPGGYTFWDVTDVDDADDPDAVVFGKMRGSNLKIGGIGHDGGRGKRIAITRLIELLRQPGTFAEVSGRMADILIGSGVPVITDPSVVKDIVRKPIEWIGGNPNRNDAEETNGWYMRNYATPDGGSSSHMKIIVGTI